MGMCQHDTVLLWFAMLAMFYGSFRLHEVFPKKKTEYDPSTTLMRKDIKLQTVYIKGSPVEVILIDLKRNLVVAQSDWTFLQMASNLAQ